jgi:uncharacterized membrane protein
MIAMNPYKAPSAFEPPDRLTVGRMLIRAVSFCGAICLTMFTAGIFNVGFRRTIGAICDTSVVIPIAMFLVFTCMPYIAFTKMPKSRFVAAHAVRAGIAGFSTLSLHIVFIAFFPSINSVLYRSIAALDIARPFVGTIHVATLSFTAVLMVISFPLIVDMVRKRSIANA